MTETLKAPFPYFGGKSTVSPEIWKRFGQVNNYIEPFCGSLAVLLGRPEPLGTYETVNDKSCMIANFWRSVKLSPREVAEHCNYPVSEIDLHSRHSWLQFEGKPSLQEKLSDDPEYFDPKIAGWWVWGMCLWIGSGWVGPHGLTASGRTVLKRPKMKSAGILTQQRKPDLSWRRGVIGVKQQLPRPGKNGVHKKKDIENWLQQLRDRLQGVKRRSGVPAKVA